ncbi:putative toxin-antitoxin system toxin component, PIN family [Ottowia sp.]|uniref:putative toxin-antitoxin system toxin component, PIN family n=1 Tax=Ottowia sp. TaxID=1898956 RepID=UPI0039E46FA5
MIDTNVLLSAALFPSGMAARAYQSIAGAGHALVVSDTVIAELRGVAVRKFPARVNDMEVFIQRAAEFALIVQTPQAAVSDEARVRDPKDRPILRAAPAAGCEVLVTGDKDLLEAGITHPRVISPGRWLAPQ